MAVVADASEGPLYLGRSRQAARDRGIGAFSREKLGRRQRRDDRERDERRNPHRIYRSTARARKEPAAYLAIIDPSGTS